MALFLALMARDDLACATPGAEWTNYDTAPFVRLDPRPPVRLSKLFADMMLAEGEDDRRHMGRVAAALLGPPHVLITRPPQVEPRPHTRAEALEHVVYAYGLDEQTAAVLRAEYNEYAALYRASKHPDDFPPMWLAAINAVRNVQPDAARPLPPWADLIDNTEADFTSND